MTLAEKFEEKYGSQFDEGFIPVPLTDKEKIPIDDRDFFLFVDAEFEETVTDDGFEYLLTFADKSTLKIYLNV